MAGRNGVRSKASQPQKVPTHSHVPLTGLVYFPIGVAVKELMAWPSGGTLSTPHWSN